MNGPMNSFFRVLLFLAIIFILGTAAASYLETNFSGFTQEEMGLAEEELP